MTRAQAGELLWQMVELAQDAGHSASAAEAEMVATMFDSLRRPEDLHAYADYLLPKGHKGRARLALRNYRGGYAARFLATLAEILHSVAREQQA